jgi:hypothetical protein
VCNYGAEMMEPQAPKFPGFFVYAWIAVKAVDLAGYKETPTTGDISRFGRAACPEMPHRYGYRNVPKCPTGYGREIRRMADRLTGRQRYAFSISCKRL